MKVRTLAFLTIVVFFVCFFSAVKAQEVRFYTSSTCGPCQLAKPKMAALAREGITVKNISVDYGAPAGITRVPTYIFVDASGREVQRWTGDAPVVAIRRLWAAREVQQPWIQWDFTKRQPYHSAVVRIGGGSGVYVELDSGVRGILTAEHVGTADIEWLNGTTTKPAGRHIDKFKHDIAFLVINDPPPSIKPLRVAKVGPKLGDTLEAAGYGGPRRELRHYSGKLVETNIDGYMKLSCAVAAGDSGGAILNAQHEVVSVVSAGEDGEWSNSEARVHPHLLVPRWTPVRDFAARLIEAIGCRPAPPPGMKPAPDLYDNWYPQGQQDCPDCLPPPIPEQPELAPPQQPNLPPGSCPNCPGTCDCDARINKLIDLQADLVIKVQSLEEKVNNIPAGKDGKDGIDGKDGRDGKDADTTSLELRIAQLEADMKKEQARKVRLELYRNHGTELIGVSEGRSTVRLNVDELE